MLKVIVLALSLLISGCVSPTSSYHESFSETYVSTDFKKVLVIGADQYRYVFDLPDSLSSVIQSPLRSTIHFLFPTMAFKVKKDGSITGYFYLMVPSTYFQEHGEQLPLAKRLGFVHGRLLYNGYHGPTGVIEDHEELSPAAKPTASGASDETRGPRGVYFIPISINGHRIQDKDVPPMPGAYHYTMNEQHKILVVDEQNGSVDLLTPFAAAVGTGVCALTLPACLAIALPAIGTPAQ